MNKKLTKLTAALALLTFLAVPMGMWGQSSTEEVTLSNGSFSTDHITWTCASGNITIQQLKGSSGTAVNSSYISAPRVYKQQILSFVGAEDYTITKIDIKCDGGYYGSTKYAGTEITDDDDVNNDDTALNATWSTTNGGTHTIETESSDGLSEIYIQNGHSNDANSQLRITKLTITYKNAGGTYTVTYDCNGGETDCPANLSDIEPGTSITLANAPTKTHFNFNGWKSGETTYEPGDSYTVNSSVTFIAQWEPDGTYFEGSICFSNQSSCTAIGSTSVTGDDYLGNTWTITTQGTNSFTPNSTYYQVGSGSKPATSITFTTTLAEEVNITDFSASFGGFSVTAGTITLKVGNTTVGTGNLNGANDVTVSNTIAKEGTTITVIVTPTAGGVKCYNISYAYETIDNPAVATTTTINVPQDFNTDIYQGTTAGTLTATVKDNNDNAISGATVTWSSSNIGVATIDANGAVTLVAAGSTTITASYAGVEDQYRPSEGTYELTVVNEDPNAPGTQNNPYTVAQAIAATPSSGTSDNVYIHGIVSKFHNNSIVGDGANYRYYISDDGTSSTELLVYKGKGLNNVAFSNADDLLVGDEVTICGGLTTYNSTKEVAANNYIVSLVRPAQYTLTNAMTNVAEYFVFVGDDEIEFDNNNQAQVRAGATVYVSLTMEDCYALTSLTVNGSTTDVTEIEPGIYYSFVMPEGDATIGVLATQATEYTLTVVGGENVTFEMLKGSESTPVTLTNGTASICEQLSVTIANLTATSDLILQSVTLTASNNTTTLTPESGVYHFNMPSSNATLTFTTTTAPTYTLATSIESGKSYIIVGFNADNAYAMGEQKTSNRAGVAITVDGTTATGNDDVHEVVITALDGDDAGKYSIKVDGGYLYASSSSANQLKTETTLNDNGKWTIVIENGEATITAQGTNSRKLMRFNPNNGNPLFACYATDATTGSSPRLYVKNEYPLTIEGYGNDNTVKSGWHLIASPVATTPSNVTNMLSNTHDLYRFNPTADKKWENYYQHQEDFDIVPGKGYLYANSETVELSFTGIPYNENGEITIEKAGWNLIGNPFYADVTVDNGRDFFKMNEGDNGSEIILADQNSRTIAPMRGIFVKTTEDNQTVTFTKVSQNANANNSTPAPAVTMNLVKNRGNVIDRAIVRFGGNNLPKFQLFENSTKLYIPQGAEEFAIVNTEAQGEMPVNFKAAENGTYTLNINAEGVEMNYLHLIDNMTGADIDLVATPSYTFEANTTDYESRFRLVFDANASTSTVSFAYFNGSEWVVNGNGTLQVVDVMGRVVSTTTVNGNASVSLNAPAGVYMLRLINGNEVKVQKMVVR